VALLQRNLGDGFDRAVEPGNGIVELALVLSAFRVRQQVDDVVTARRSSGE
jgi:hypothetical protein